MIDIQETKKVNNAMVEIMKQSLADPRIMLSMEGYLVTSDSSQNPHTSIEIFLNSMDLRGYTVIYSSTAYPFTSSPIATRSSLSNDISR